MFISEGQRAVPCRGVGWAVRLGDAPAPPVRRRRLQCRARRSAEHQLAMAKCDSDTDDQIIICRHASRRARQQWDGGGACGYCGAGVGGVACVRRLSKTRT